MIKTALILFSAIVTAHAEPTPILFKPPETFPLSIRLLVSQKTELVSHNKADSPETIVVKMTGDGQAGMLVEIVDRNGARLWHHDFGYNLSATPGCSLSASFHPTLPAVILSYHGYKWDHDHKLLFATKKDSGYEIREQTGDVPEIAAFLKTQQGYDPEYKYWIYPQRFADHHLVFSCIPLELPKHRSPHPFAQDLRWFDIKATLDEKFAITPISATVSHE